MAINATLSNPSSVTGTTTTASSVAASTQAGAPVPQVTRMAVEGIRGADGDMTWAGEWSSSANYVANQVVQYNGSAYVCIQGHSNLRPDQNATQWTLMVSKGDAGQTGATGATGSAGAKGATGDPGPAGASGSQGATGPAGPAGAKGDQGDDGIASTVTIGSVTKVSAASSAAVTNSGTSRDAVLNFSIPSGANGAAGPTGADGADGTAATIAVGSTTTGNAGTNASVTNSGSSSAATFNFTIPRGNTGATGAQGPTGATGATGANGTAATVSIGTVSTGLPGSSASVTNSGSSTAATLDITIPRGNTGADGDLTWKGGWSSSTAYSTNEAVQYNGSSYIAVANNQNVTPTSDTTKWNLMAQAGAEGGAISSMEDTVISSSVPDMSVLAYDNGATKWKDKSIFTGTFASPQLDGGVF